MNIRHAFPVIAFGAVLLCACNSEQPYTITGTLDLPAQLPYGDTIIDVPSFDDTWVYLVDFDSNVIDSTLIQDNSFSFFGSVKPKDAYFVQLACQIGQTLIAIEPGDIEVVITPDFIVSGTPSNDCITDLESVLADLNNSIYTHLGALSDSLQQLGEELTDEMALQVADDYRNAMNAILDSTYEANKDNLGASYAVLMRHSDVQTSTEFEKALADYPEEIRNSQLVQVTLQQLRLYEKMMQEGSSDILDSLMVIPSDDEVAGDDEMAQK